MYNEFKNLAFYDPLHEISATVPSDIVHFTVLIFLFFLGWLSDTVNACRGYSGPRYERTMLL